MEEKFIIFHFEYLIRNRPTKGSTGKFKQVWREMGTPGHIALKVIASDILVASCMQKIWEIDRFLPEKSMIKESCNLIRWKNFDR